MTDQQTYSKAEIAAAIKVAARMLYGRTLGDNYGLPEAFADRFTAELFEALDDAREVEV